MGSSHQVLNLEPVHNPSQQHASPSPNAADVEKLTTEEQVQMKKSVYAGLGWLDRLLVLWILLAIVVGILLGNFVNDIGPALQKGKFVDVSIPIGKPSALSLIVLRPR